MTIALTEDELVLAEVARSFIQSRSVRQVARDTLEHRSSILPPFWSELCDLGWTGLHLPEAWGGQGFGLAELAVVTEALGYAVAPGPFLPTALAGAVVLRTGRDSLRKALLPGLSAGTTIGAVGVGGTLASTNGSVSGDGGFVLGGALADLLLLRVGDDLVAVDRASPNLTLTECDSLDPTRRLVHVVLDALEVDDESILVGAAGVAEQIGRVLAAAEAAGGARACTDMAVAYAKDRHQFGRPIGAFQAVKHHCADMLVDTELATAAAWNAARSVGEGDQAVLAAAVAATQAIPGYRRCAERTIQVHGGIGYTWEHDAHLHLRRAAVLAAVFGADRAAPLQVQRTSRVERGVAPALDLPPEAETYRQEARSFRSRYDTLPPTERRDALIDSGYLVPHWPKPWGRGAGVVEQLVLEEELADIEGPDLGIGTWVLLTLVQHGTPEQIDRWIRPSLDGRLRWCQLFSEPNAGSDAAAIQTRAVRGDGGWVVSGQKVWTSDARGSNRGLATVRTDPEAAKHAGITAMAIDMAAPGVEIRPLRELTGETLFNEVFFDEVFVPDRDVVGSVNDGWRVARATLGNERISIGGNRGRLDLFHSQDLVALVDEVAPDDPGTASAVGVLVAEEHSMSALNLRHIARAMGGGPPGAEGNLTKLLSAEHAQRVAGLAMRIAGPPAVVGQQPRLTHTYLFSRCLTIAGGTSEIIRNVIAEQILGLPRERSPQPTPTVPTPQGRP